MDAKRNAFVGIAERRLNLKTGFGLSWMSEFCKLVAQFGEALMSNDEIRIHAKMTDLVISDTAFFAAPVFATYHNISWVYLSPFGHMAGTKGDLLGVAVNPSYVPVFVGTAEFERVGPPQSMGFLDRSFNFVASISCWFVRELIISRSLDNLTRKYGTDWASALTRKTSMILIPMDYSFEYARFDPPTVKVIGPLTPRETENGLESPFSNIIQGANGSVVLIVSLGITNALNRVDAASMLRAFQSIPNVVIIKYNTTTARLLTKDGVSSATARDRTPLTKSNDDQDDNGCNIKCPPTRHSEGASSASTIKTDSTENINRTACNHDTEAEGQRRKEVCLKEAMRSSEKLVEHHGGLQLRNDTYIFDWLPQQDLLQNSPNAVLFSHCGTNSIYEALYHGRLIICMPLFGDHFDGAGHVLSRRVGRVITMRSLSKETLEEELGILINDKTYLENVRKISRRLRRRVMPPVKLAAFWIETVLAEGGDVRYLKPACADMPLYVYLCLDVILFWLVSFGLLVKLICYKMRRNLCQ